jgi:hypothetical protein
MLHVGAQAGREACSCSARSSVESRMAAVAELKVLVLCIPASQHNCLQQQWCGSQSSA